MIRLRLASLYPKCTPWIVLIIWPPALDDNQVNHRTHDNWVVKQTRYPMRGAIWWRTNDHHSNCRPPNHIMWQGIVFLQRYGSVCCDHGRWYNVITTTTTVTHGHLFKYISLWMSDIISKASGNCTWVHTANSRSRRLCLRSDVFHSWFTSTYIARFTKIQRVKTQRIVRYPVPSHPVSSRALSIPFLQRSFYCRLQICSRQTCQNSQNRPVSYAMRVTVNANTETPWHFRGCWNEEPYTSAEHSFRRKTKCYPMNNAMV